MALVDWEAVVQDLKAHVRSKNSHGQRELTDFLADAEVRHRQIEGLVEKSLRLWGDELVEAVTVAPASTSPVGASANGAKVDRS
jgi:hypothetical protein